MSVLLITLVLSFPLRYRRFSGLGLFQGQENHEMPQTSLLERSVWISKSCLHTRQLKVIFDFTKPQRQPEERFWEEQISRGTLLIVERDFWMWSGLSTIAWGLGQGERKENWVQVSMIYSSRINSFYIFWTFILKEVLSRETSTVISLTAKRFKLAGLGLSWESLIKQKTHFH